jgi:hypothetical protein
MEMPVTRILTLPAESRARFQLNFTFNLGKHLVMSIEPKQSMLPDTECDFVIKHPASSIR